MLQDWKETAGYVCGMVSNVKPYLMKSQLRCWDAIETQYYGSGRGDICAICGNDENVLSSEEVKYEKDVKGKEPLPLCEECVGLNIIPPIKQGRTKNFVEKARQQKKDRTAKRKKAVSLGLRKAQKKRRKRN